MSTAGNEHEAIVEESAVVDYCGEIYPIRADQEFLIGREADLCIDNNPFLHRRLVRISCHDGMWWLDNVGSRIAVTVADESGSMQARVPGLVSRLCSTRSSSCSRPVPRPMSSPSP